MSITGFLSYYAEVLIYGWEGLKWTGNFYWTLLFIPIIFTLWLKFIAVKELSTKQIIKFLLSYFLTYIGIFILVNLIYNLKLTAFLLYAPFLPFEALLPPAFLDGLIRFSVFINIILIFLILFIENIKVQKILNFELKKYEKIILLFQPIYIFVTAKISMVLLYHLKVFPLMNKFNLFDSIFIFKTGTIIFSSVLFEGLFILYKTSYSKVTQSTTRTNRVRYNTLSC